MKIGRIDDDSNGKGSCNIDMKRPYYLASSKLTWIFITVVMVLRIAGWVFTHDQVRKWLERGGREYKTLEYYELTGALKEWFEERQIRYMAPIPTDYPHGSKQPIILLTTRFHEDPASTVAHYTRFRERDVDRKVKRQVLEETGLKDDDLRWVTVVDPYFHHDVVYKYPRNYVLWPETGMPPEEDEAENKEGGDKGEEKGDKDDRGKKEEAGDKAGE